MVNIGILDYAQIDEGSNSIEALHNSVKLVQLAERLNYKRFWVAEHHDVPAFASSSPEMVMMRLADATERIRIGSGGVMLPHYSPYKIAENFRILDRKSTRLNSSHVAISYDVFCLKIKRKN